MSGDCVDQPAVFYSKKMTRSKKIAIKHAIENGNVAYTQLLNDEYHMVRWRNGSIMQE